MNVPTPVPGSAIDPTLLAIRVKRVRQTKDAAERVKHRLVTYIGEHAPEQCADSRGCTAAVDGILLLSCGHFAFTCSKHASEALAHVHYPRRPAALLCSDPEFDLHAPSRTVTLEWCGLA